MATSGSLDAKNELAANIAKEIMIHYIDSGKPIIKTEQLSAESVGEFFVTLTKTIQSAIV